MKSNPTNAPQGNLHASALPTRNLVPVLAVVVSCLFSLYSILANPLLNNDAFGYLRAAELFNSAGIDEVLDDYGWYGYSMLIAIADRALPGGLLASAQILNTLCHALLVFVFIRLCAEYVPDDSRQRRRIEIFAALTILGFPLINEMRYFLIRDFAYWAFALWSLLQLVRYNRNPRWRTALWFCLGMLGATLFRLEGLLLAALAPLALLPDTSGSQPRLRKIGMLVGLLLAVAWTGFALALMNGINLLEEMQFAYRYYLPGILDLGDVLMASTRELNEALFTTSNFPEVDNTVLGLVILLFAYALAVFLNLILALGMPFSLLLAYGLWRARLPLPPHLRGPLLTFAGVSALMLLLFIFIMNFLTQRYATLLCLLLLTLVPGILDRLHEQARLAGRARHFWSVVGFFCVYFYVDSLISFGHSRDYMVDAIAWSAQNLPEDAPLHTNNPAIAHGSGRVAEYDKVPLDASVALQQAASRDYLMLDIRREDEELKAQLDANPQLQLVTRFANERGNEVRVYLHR